ncbi:putative glycerol dehydrogenase (GCY1) [Aspergillus fumigatus Af293]|uniref:D-xylose reductase [NAD(P)H] n=1 Tax=Aspergillus fumigatus (strain ATCC MYA-4609 / CBS 101355 / FGSC A1100 / Af293) TaxID=330879 RepID=Q4WF80_ASPFU|nr:glycerol dehydrogenase (GCY1), putative [Aspergillus fumigatus Af293]EAL86597.1 glycerol dehydrogenase (GCY1), putative [Aspergillus fumigatus Af293]KEY83343.1 glycerol dehydrogenase Gcy1 [Aspergillus fumigatus]
MALPTHFKLNTGAQIPAIGLGTWRSEPGQVRQAVSFALKNGYSHIDTAFTKLARASRIVVSLAKTFSSPANCGTPTSPTSLKVSRRPLTLWARTTLISISSTGQSDYETWRQMEEIYKAGKVKAIGVANWSIPYLEELKKKWTVVPAVNQVELHPFLPQHALKEWCDKHGILLEAYSPLGSEGAPLMSDPAIQEMAKKYGVSPATVLISYHVNRGVVVLPKSTQENRILSNRQVIPLSPEDMDVLNGLAAQGKARRINTPLFGWDLGFDDWYQQ